MGREINERYKKLTKSAAKKVKEEEKTGDISYALSFSLPSPTL